MGKRDYTHNMGKNIGGDRLYGDAVNNPQKFCGNSLGAGKGDRRRPLDENKFRENYDKIDWEK